MEKKTNFVEYNRNEEGNISNYIITSYKADDTPFVVELSREQMELLMASYSRYGLNLPKAAISPEFELINTENLERIIIACAIYKYDVPFAPHQIEELSEEELLDVHRKIIENKVIKKLEKQAAEVELKETQKALRKVNKELAGYKNLENVLKNLQVNITNIPKVKYNDSPESGKSIMLHISDMHIGAKVESDCIYPNPYDRNEIHRRLEAILTNVHNIGPFDEIIVNELGDSIDGIDQQTARRDHVMPQCMDNKEQIETYIEEMVWFLTSLKSLTKNLSVYCVPEGNHGGTTEYASHYALQSTIRYIDPEIEFYLSRDFISSYWYKDRLFICTHGKDAKFEKKPLPKYLNDATQNFFNNWIRKNGLMNAKNVHIIKGDLHSDVYDSCEAFTYRNVLSLFGASDYSAYNYIPNNYGVSYELFIGDNMLSGTFTNL